MAVPTRARPPEQAGHQVAGRGSGMVSARAATFEPVVERCVVFVNKVSTTPACKAMVS